MRSPYPEFVLSGVICIEKASKGIEIMFILTGIHINRVFINNVLLVYLLINTLRINLLMWTIQTDIII